MTAKKKPRIALLASGVLGGPPGGRGIPVLADLFQRLSDHYEIVYYSAKPIDAGSVPPSIKTKEISRWPFPERIKFWFPAIAAAVDHFVSPYDLFFAVSVYPNGRSAVWLSRLFKKPSVVQMIAMEALADPLIGDLRDSRMRRITEKVCEKTSELVTVAHHQKQLAERDLPTQREITVLPLRINAANFTYAARHITFPVQFIHVAYYSIVKDQDTLFAAFAIVARSVDCHLTVIGGGFDIPDVKTMLDRLGISDKVTFLGLMPYSEIPRHLNQAHVLLHTARFETGCAVIQEAMASGVAVCGTEVGILADIGDEYAVVVPPRQPEALAEKIIQLVNDEKKYREMTKRAFEWISSHDAVWSFRNYLSFLDDILKGNK